MRVLVLANLGLGLYKFRRELLEEMVKNNEVYFSVPFDEFVAPIEEIGCRFIDNPLLDRHGLNPMKELRLIAFYKKVIRDVRPDIVFTYTIKPNVYGGIVCASLGVPYVANITGLGISLEKSGLLQKICLMLYKKGLSNAQKIFFQNTENRDFMLSMGILKKPYDLLPGSGVNLRQYNVYPYPTCEEVNFVFIARVMKEKGIEQYLQAAKEIRKRHPKAKFHVCGFCEQSYEKILNELDKNGTIIYHGLLTDMESIYKMSSCTIHPTYYPEGLSNVLLESAASGRPIITTDRAGCREVVEDGVNGLIVHQRNSRDLIEKIEKFLSMSIDERKKMGLAGRRKVEREYDREIVVNKYMKEIDFVRAYHETECKQFN